MVIFSVSDKFNAFYFCLEIYKEKLYQWKNFEFVLMVVGNDKKFWISFSFLK